MEGGVKTGMAQCTRDYGAGVGVGVGIWYRCRCMQCGYSVHDQ